MSERRRETAAERVPPPVVLHRDLTVWTGLGPHDRCRAGAMLLAAAGDDGDGRRGGTAPRRALTADDLEPGGIDPLVRALAGVEQRALWAAADRLDAATAALAEARACTGDGPRSPDTIAAVEAGQERLLSDRARSVRERRVAVVLACAAGLSTVPLGPVTPGWTPFAVGFGALALGVGATRHRAVRRSADAARRELEAFGVDSLLGLQLRRVDAMLGVVDAHRSVALAAAAHERARADWESLAGPVELEHARARRGEVVAAALAEHDLDGVLERLNLVAEVHREVRDRMRAFLVAAATQPAGELLVVDEPVAHLPAPVATALLDAIARAAARRQTVILTGDPATTAWARLEALSGSVAVTGGAWPAPAGGPAARHDPQAGAVTHPTGVAVGSAPSAGRIDLTGRRPVA